jgi:hypothetical protein
MGMHEPRFVLFLDIRLAQHQLQMLLGRNSARQVEHTTQARADALLPFLLAPLLLVRRFNWWLAHDCRQFIGDSFEYARWCQHADMRDVWCLISVALAPIVAASKRQ